MRDLSAYDCCDNRLQLDFNKVVLILALILLGVSSAKPVPIFFYYLTLPEYLKSDFLEEICEYIVVFINI